MKILLLNYEFFPIGGGGSTVTKFLAEELAKKGNDVNLITSKYKNLKNYEVINNVKIHRVRVVRKYRDRASIFEMFTYIISAFFYSRRFVKKEKPDIMHAFFVVPSGAVAYFLHKLYKIPYIIYLGGSDVPGVDKDRYGIIYNIVAPFIRLIWRNASFTIAASKGLKGYARSIDKKVPLTVIPNGVDLNRFRPQVRKKKNIIKLLAIGRLIPRKGFQYIIEALPEVINKSNKNFELQIIGSGPYQEDLHRLVKRNQIENKVKFLGLVEYDNLIKYYRNADILINSSYGEGMPLVVLEAMATGLPIIATRVPGNEELVKNNYNGFIVRPKDSKELAHALIKMLNNDTLRERMSRNSLKIIKNYNWEKITEEYVELYKQLLQKNQQF